MILRKGSVSAKAGEKLLIPINMRDGSLICSGKGNEDWNCSAPHGAGRLMSRKAAFNALSMEEFQKSDEQNRQKEQPTNKANGNRKSLGRLKGAKTVAR